MHGLPQLLACLDVEERHGKENYGEQQHRYILHPKSLNSSRIGAGPALREKFRPPAARIQILLRIRRGTKGEPDPLLMNDSGFSQV